MFIDPQALISEHFTFHEALHLPRWGRLAAERDGLTTQVLSNLQDIFKRMDQVREFLETPIFVHVAYRPAEYNREVGGSPDSAHLCLGTYAAVDWSCALDLKDVKRRLAMKLEDWDLCMENNGPKATWIHLDTKPPRRTGRFFRP